MKPQIIERLGQSEILLPALIAEGLSANDKVKLRLSVLQAAERHARDPQNVRFDLAEECRAAGLDGDAMEGLANGAVLAGGEQIVTPGLDGLIAAIWDDVATMARAVAAGDAAAGEAALQRLAEPDSAPIKRPVPIPGGAQDVTSCWDADNYPEIWLDQIIAQDRAVDLPIITHPVGGAKPPFYPGLPLEATLRICREVPNVVGWKMTYMYDGFRLIANGLRGLNHHVAVMGALASRFHEYKATGMFDGTLSGFWNFALEPMLDHLEAWDAKDIDKARRIWNSGLVQLHEYIADMGRLHIRYKTATWLRGLIPNPFMRSPMPKPKQAEIDMLYRLLKALNFEVIERRRQSLRPELMGRREKPAWPHRSTKKQLTAVVSLVAFESEGADLSR